MLQKLEKFNLKIPRVKRSKYFQTQASFEQKVSHVIVSQNVFLVLWPSFSQCLEVSRPSSTGHFVDLGEENASVWSPSPKTYLEKRRPHRRSGGAAARQTFEHQRTPEAAPHQLHAHTRRNGITRYGRCAPSLRFFVSRCLDVALCGCLLLFVGAA